MFWEILGALILGFFLSATFQALVSKGKMRWLLPDDSPPHPRRGQRPRGRPPRAKVTKPVIAGGKRTQPVPRDADARPHPKLVGPARPRVWGTPHGYGADRQHGEVDHERQAQRAGRVLGQQAADQRSRSNARQVRRRGDHGGGRSLQRP